MTHLMLNVLLQVVAMAPGGNDYATAFEETQQTGKPLVVLVGADWCPGCRQMKYTTIPQLQRNGQLQGVAFAYVNTDQQRRLAGQLMRGNSIPQLVMYRKTDDGWMRKHLTGAQSQSSVASFLLIGTPAAQVSQRKQAAQSD